MVDVLVFSLFLLENVDSRNNPSAAIWRDYGQALETRDGYNRAVARLACKVMKRRVPESSIDQFDFLLESFSGWEELTEEDHLVFSLEEKIGGQEVRVTSMSTSVPQTKSTVIVSGTKWIDPTQNRGGRFP